MKSGISRLYQCYTGGVQVRPIFSLLQVLEDGRAVTLDGVLVFHIEFAEQSPAYRLIVLALFGLLSCRLYQPCGGIGPAGLAVWQDGETSKVIRRAAVSFARYNFCNTVGSCCRWE